MRTFIMCAMLASAVAGGALAAETGGRVAVQSAEGQAIVRKVVDLSQRLGLPNPFVAPEPVVFDRNGRPLTDPTLADLAPKMDRVDGRLNGLQRPAKLARGAQKHLMAERTALLSKLDLDAETRNRIDQDLSVADKVRLGLN